MFHSTRRAVRAGFVPAMVAARVPAMVAAIAALAALAASPAVAGERRSAGADASGATLYHNYCSVCHGDRGDGQSRARNSFNPPPRDFTSAQSLAELSRARMLLAVREGRPGTAMVGWKTQLSERQTEIVVDYVRETFMRATTAQEASRGRQLYAANCAVCHGDRGNGAAFTGASLNPPPRNFTAPAARVELTRERMIASVAAGRPGTAMAAFAAQLSAADIGAVVDYVRGAFMLVGSDAGISGTRAHATPASGGAPASAPAHAVSGAMGSAAGSTTASTPAAMAAQSAPPMRTDMRLPLPFGLTGDPDKGRAFYDRNCATCHGTAGDGNGPRAYFINPKPRSFVTAASRDYLNRPILFTAVAGGKRGTEMPAWEKVLTRQEMANVAEYVFRAFIRSGEPAVAAAAPTAPAAPAAPAPR